MFRYYRFNEIYVEADLERCILKHWNPKTLVGKDDKVSEYVLFKLIEKKLEPIHKEEFAKMFDSIGYFNWIKHPKIIGVKLEITAKIN